MTSRFLEQLDARPLLCDGAMGTMIYSKGIPFERFDLAAEVIEAAKQEAAPA